jgi:hypothetical protein
MAMSTDEDRIDRAAEDLRVLHRLAVERSLALLPAGRPSEAMPSLALRMSDVGTIAEETGEPGERGADPLYAALFVGAAEGRVRALAVVTGITMHHEHTGVAHEALAVDLEHRDVPPVTLYVMVDRGGAAPRVERTIPTDGRAMVFPKDGGDDAG